MSIEGMNLKGRVALVTGASRERLRQLPARRSGCAKNRRRSI
jgi:hypothetical protein